MSTIGLSLTQIFKKLDGSPESVVTLTLKNASTGIIQSIPLRRRLIPRIDMHTFFDCNSTTSYEDSLREKCQHLQSFCRSCSSDSSQGLAWVEQESGIKSSLRPAESATLSMSLGRSHLLRCTSQRFVHPVPSLVPPDLVSVVWHEAFANFSCQ